MRADLMGMQDAPPLLGVPPRPDVGDGSLPPFDHDLAPDFFRAPRRSRMAAGISLLLAALVILGAAGQPLIRAWQARGRSHEFTFMAMHGSEPVRWNPCEPIHYVVNLGAAPAGSLADVQAAALELSGATGIVFAYDGLSEEVPSLGRDPYQPDRYGDRWAPVLIGWVDPTESSFDFDPGGREAAGVAGPLTAGALQDIYVSGVVAINVADPNPPGFGSPGSQGPVLLHELAHVLGLGHIKVQGELMEPSGGGVVDFGPGDLEGLRQLGRAAGCQTTPEMPSE
jgi:hypothetical protein